MNNPQAQRRVLVVEDEPIIRDFVCEVLGLEGFETEACESADQALDCLEDHAERFQLLITDVRMPGSSMDGAELTDRVLVQWPMIPVIIMSGHGMPETARIADQVEFLPKPWTMGQLINSVEKLTAAEPARH
ncbi:response regulator [Pseudomonas sp. C2L12B]|uniref:Response regulator n=2 Tax=Pseudomonas typographi TaxID=2715964 RepID=A0ABR7Z8N2_9PSED|nr:response regulator [Pseudomonas typographi]MBD1589705.1 response regulator [Pseudomonas typographi]MBD1601728.1 response regulator [Pseudomonas typographi]